MAVRDYECDLQGIVNNAVYQNYLEHVRHEYLRSLGLDFARLRAEGHDLVLTRCEIDYRLLLKSGDRFAVRLNASQESRLRSPRDRGLRLRRAVQLCIRTSS